jgi:hypothetical protein
MTDHDAMKDIAIDDIDKNESVQDGEDGVENMDFETFEDEADYVSPQEISQKTAEQLKQVELTSKIGKAIYRLQTILH